MTHSSAGRIALWLVAAAAVLGAMWGYLAIRAGGRIPPAVLSYTLLAVGVLAIFMPLPVIGAAVAPCAVVILAAHMATTDVVRIRLTPRGLTRPVG